MRYVCEPLEPAETAVDLCELAEFIAVDLGDPLLEAFASAATSIVIEYLQCELIDRERSVRYFADDCRRTGGLYRASQPCGHMRLPYANLASVDAVEIDGEPATSYATRPGKPFEILLSGSFGNEVEIQYTAGFGPSVGDVPAPIQLAIKMLAAFLYEHRGACEASDALEKSGAASVLTPFKYGAFRL